MIRKRILLFLAGLLLCININSQSLADYVKPIVGSDSEFSLSNGNTYPATAIPWGMNFWTPQTAENGDGWQYAYDSPTLHAFKCTHQASPWLNDYGSFSIFPRTGKVKTKEKERGSYYSHKRETSLPYYYQAYLSDYDIWGEITPSDRGAIMRFTFPSSDSAHLVIDAFPKGSKIKVEGNTISGYTSYNNGGVADNFKHHFIIQLNKDISSVHFYDKHQSVSPTNDEYTGEHVVAVVHFNTDYKEVVEARIGTSFISYDQAMQNLNAEIGNKTFGEVKAQAKSLWEEYLGRIMVSGGSLQEKQNFYTALYRVCLFPRKLWEISATGDTLHYSPFNGKIESGLLYTDNGFWDTFRAVFPLFTLVYPDQNKKFMRGLVNTYKESGWLPEWASPGHRNVMIGSNSASIIADAYLKGIRGYDIETLYEGILKNSENEGPLPSVGRLGVDYYNSLGYVPYDVGINENAARTLEYAYDDYCIWQLAKAMNRPAKEINRFRKRADNYRNLFDPSTGLMRGKNKNGTFQSPFNPYKWGDAFTEGNSWHYTWSVFHDVQGLIDLMGGREQFATKLDSVFYGEPKFDFSYYGFQIHEITEMLIAGMGQYAHGNQPIQHGVYLYNYAGQPWKTQKWAREVMNILYLPTPDGLCGDEDNGQTSAWYVFSAMGMYPVAPGTGEYVLGSPLFDEIRIKLPGEKKFTIRNHNNSADNVYVDKVYLNGSTHPYTFIKHKTITNGGFMENHLTDKPNKKRGTHVEQAPYSMSKEE